MATLIGNLTGFHGMFMGYRIEVSRDSRGRYRAWASRIDTTPSAFMTPNYYGKGSRQAALRDIYRQIGDAITSAN